MAFLNKGIKITLTDERDGKKKKDVFHFEGGLKEFVKFLNNNKDALHEEAIYFEISKKTWNWKLPCSILTGITN